MYDAYLITEVLRVSGVGPEFAEGVQCCTKNCRETYFVHVAKIASAQLFQA